MGSDDGFFSRTLEGAMTGASVGAVAGTMSGFWNSAGIRFNREQVARQVLPTIYKNLGYLAGVGASYRAGEALMETWTGKEGAVVNTAFGGAVSGAFIGFRSGHPTVMVATAGACALGCVAIHLNGNKFA
ncbi:Mitochondrial inner membrane translocase subunit Tim17/Tim22/Tim23/peroxisomal protein PMP24 [Nannochloropsis gaditana]|uniref:Mitochondrial inner membrane translocase subunit Tim17/Tim22/Tim23/peroxisomal protein PMP24 n=2 Tax=Nannochloropsis gaditana TaxID=72520 RepID=W7TMM3_9STRA|nr:Mitochondrial inner membrane translocase subunit Tim17/Tim22/Tim23/peroxisomal protein PMP24 [Nannochloropsis gaditana]